MTMTPPIRVILAEDHLLVRAGIKSLLNGLAGIEVVAEASDGIEVVNLSAALAPDVILMDVAMPSMSGLQALRVIHHAQPGVKIIMLSMYTSEEHVIRPFEMGACGYVLKNSAPQELEQAIRVAVKGGQWFPSELSLRAVKDYLSRVHSDVEQITLTSRQKDVLKLIADGLSTKEIAFALDLSVKTVETYRAQLMHKLNAHDVASLVRCAFYYGIAEL